MRTSLCLSAVAVLTLGLSACGIGTSKTTGSDSGPAPASQAPAAASSAPAGSKSSAAAGASSAPASNGGSSSGGSAAGNQDTPEGAAMMLLRGYGNKDANAICDVMAVQGKPINQIGAGDMCAKQIQSSLDTPGGSLDDLKNAKVSNVKVNGDTADLAAATVTPSTAKIMLSLYKTAKKIDGKWYVSMG